MQIDLPTELVERLRDRASKQPDASEADVLRIALDALDSIDVSQPSPEQLAWTLRELERGVAEMERGEAVTLEQAKTLIFEHLGIDSQQ